MYKAFEIKMFNMRSSIEVEVIEIHEKNGFKQRVALLSAQDAICGHGLITAINYLAYTFNLKLINVLPPKETNASIFYTLIMEEGKLIKP
ncbi:MAG: hypothetical protein PHG83_03755 [Patescibacteria group bacterium]|nr:hypothetical protein [Patescibacteria group bacterium]